MVELQAPVAKTIPGDQGDWARPVDHNLLRINTAMAVSLDVAKAAIRPLLDRASLQDDMWSFSGPQLGR